MHDLCLGCNPPGWYSLSLPCVDVHNDVKVELSQAHDIGERLEVLIESLPEIERCHVHLDWETEHKAEHQGKAGGLFSLPSSPNASPRATSPAQVSPDAGAGSPIAPVARP
jgi:hypothetical protein